MAASKLSQQTKIYSVLALKSILPLTDVIFMYQPEDLEVVYKKGAFKNFVKITNKDLCQGLFLNKVSGRAAKSFSFLPLDDCFTYVSFKFPESLNRVSF